MKLSQLALTSLAILAASPFAEAATTCSGAELYSKSSVKFGRWEIRMKVAATPGSVSSFFTYYNDSYLGAPRPWREIDIEVLGNKPGSFQSNLITGNLQSKETSEDVHALAGLANGFHTFELDWTPDSVVWRLDGVVQRKTDGSDQQVVDLRDSAQSWRMNLWASSSVGWVGAFDLSKLPVAQVVNWMRYSAYTPGRGPGGSDFTFSWLDDFDRLDKTRWAFGDWTFDENLAQFDPSNGVVKDGYLALLLTRPGEEGVMGAMPTDPKGSAYSVASTHAMAGKTGFRAVAAQGGFWIEGAEGALEVRETSGKLLWSGNADSHGKAWIATGTKGLAMVRSGGRTGSVVIR
ncbi:MAG: glycoside hydrolase family 16 protein [Fibrobacteres bacterium]|jgi:endo-1,3-1,4-beta-glycanase ExoK|nr:glycoside hydrolase family 16 protein [Fibrobacterota bacterium]